MSVLLGTSRRRAEDFADALDTGRVADPTVTSLFALADELAAMPLGPRAEFRSQLRRRLVSVAAVPPPRAAPTTVADRLSGSLGGWRGQRRLSFAAGVLAVLVLIGGVGLVGSSSLPGDPFYGVKRAAESAQIATAHGKLAKGQRHLQFAATRLREVSALVGRNSALVAAAPGRPTAGRLALSARTTKLVLDTLSEMDSEVVAGTRDLTEYWRQSGEARPLRALDTFAHAQHAKLAEVLPALPVSARTPGMQALELLTSVRERAQALIAQGPCDAACQSISGGLTMSGGFDVLGPTPCSGLCPGSGAAPAPAADVTVVVPTPGFVVVSPSPALVPSPSGFPSPTPTDSPWPSPSESMSPEPSGSPSMSPEPSGSPSESPEPSVSPSVSPSESPEASPSESASPLPSPAETTSPPAPVDPSATPEPSPNESPSPSDDPADPASSPSPTDTGSPPPST